MLDLVNYVLSGFMILVFLTWLFLLKTMIKDHAATPRLEREGSTDGPMVSVILPARNEEKYIEKCLESLAAQDYKNLEIIAIDDSSTDETGNIIEKMSKKHKNIIHVKADSKPDGWVGKNWPCAQGRKRATGKLLFFTDADTVHSPRALSMALAHMSMKKLDAITVMPRLLTLDFWTAVTMPMITVFLNTVYSASKVNDPSKSTGYFYGSFFIINANVYDEIGGHYRTRGEIVEDGVLGRIVKNSKYKMLIVSGTKNVTAVWARDRRTLWNAIKRLMVPIASSNQKQAVGITTAVAFLMMVPFGLVAYASAFLAHGIDFQILFASSMAAAIAAFVGAAVNSRIIQRSMLYSIFAPLGGAVLTLGFLSGALVPNGGSVSWRDTKYSDADCKQSTPNV